MQTNPPRKAIKQSTMTLILMITSIVLLILFGISFYFIITSNAHLDKTAADRYEMFENAQRFMDGSAYLTNEVRAFAATGNPAHAENYYNEVNVAKNRDIAVANMRNIGITYHEGALVTEMFALSNNLIPLEEEAIRLAEAGDIDGALEAVYGWSYEDWIARIRQTQVNFIKMLNDRTDQQLARDLRTTRMWTIISFFCLAVTAIIQIVTVTLIRVKVIRPLALVRDEMIQIERGDLHSEFSTKPDASELGMLIGSMQATKHELNNYILEISEKLAAIADGDSTARIVSDYPGDFMQIKTSINEISEILTDQRSEEKRILEQLRAAYEEANSANRAKSNFLSNMSHEMRTPMNAVLGMTNIALASDDPARREYCLHKITDASNHLLGVINDILDMSKIDSGKFELSPTEFIFEKMLIRVVNIINFRVDEKHQHLTVDLDPKMPTAIIADEQRLAQVITNLLSNAVKFTPENGHIQMEIRLVEESIKGCRIYVAVKDDGIGISPEQQRKLFSSFMQADAGISRKFGGTGLGLAISKNIIELMDGRIWVESEEGSGSTFAFEFIAQRGIELEPPEPLLQGVRWEDLRVLVVDDDPAIYEYFSSIGKRNNFNCDVASSGIEALEKLDSGNRYNIFFIDWKMPGLNGIELTQRIRESGEHNAVIIMISSTEWPAIEQQARAAGVDKFLPKPLFMSVVIDAMTECIGAEMCLDKPVSVEMPDFRDKHILLAEDIDINREIVLSLLEPTGVTITCAENGQIALDTFANNPDTFDMIFMDMHMPEMDGSTATAKIRALDIERAKTIPIVAMTANVFREDVERCLAVGMNDHIGKPLNFDEVLEKMKTYLR